MKAFLFFLVLFIGMVFNEYRNQINYRQVLHKYYNCTNSKTYYRLKPITVQQYKSIFSKHSNQLVCTEAYYTKQYVDLLTPN